MATKKRFKPEMARRGQGGKEPAQSPSTEPHSAVARACRLVLGIGASAGGVEALEQLFAHLPPRDDIALVVVLHQPKEHVSALAEVLGRWTSMAVREVTERVAIEPGTVYLARPGDYLEVRGDALVPNAATGEHLTCPVDHLFEGLARQFNERAAGIVLSGAGSDGARGLRAIHSQLGLTMVQSERSASFPGMPHSAIAAEQPDFVLPVEQIPNELLAYLDQGTRVAQDQLDAPSHGNAAGQAEILDLLRMRLGHGFEGYKESTLRRRIERRMKLHHFSSPADYRRFLEQHPVELKKLFEELLIGVTAFFRDREPFEHLERALVQLLCTRPPGQPFRVWVPGCSTGEEAYSLAIVLREAMDRTGCTFPLQVFATDVDANAIERARIGLYHGTTMADVSPERLARFFMREQDYVRVRKDLRECLVFAVQNLVEDPPLTRIDLLSCRNLLIYFDAQLQQRILPVLHHALKPEGLLFLGTSESLGAFAHLFDAVDKKQRIFRRREVALGTYVAELPGGVAGDGLGRDAAAPFRTPRRAESVTAQLAERALLRDVLPPTVIFRERGDIVHIHGRTGQFLEPAPGPQTTMNLFGMAREGLQLELPAAVRQLVREGGEVVRRGVLLHADGHPMLVDLRLKRLVEPEPLRALLVVSFERLRPAVASERGSERPNPPEASPRMLELEQELLYTKESLQSTIEELEAANQELTSTNEELQSTNEELQSTNEELETSKEELQSLNEELQTVNTELQSKVDELSHANDDMTNLFDATDVATLFLDSGLNIKRYTEQAKRIIRLIPSDVGRSIGDLVSHLSYDRLVHDAREVLRTQNVKECEVRSFSGSWYLMRVMPYRTTHGGVDGLVITCVDISRIKELQQSESRMVRALQNSPVRVFGHDRDGRFTWVCSSLFGRSQAELIGKTDEEALGKEGRAFRELKQQVVETGKPARKRLSANLDGESRTYDLYVEPQYDGQELVGTSSVLVDESHDL